MGMSRPARQRYQTAAIAGALPNIGDPQNQRFQQIVGQREPKWALTNPAPSANQNFTFLMYRTPSKIPLLGGIDGIAIIAELA